MSSYSELGDDYLSELPTAAYVFASRGFVFRELDGTQGRASVGTNYHHCRDRGDVNPNTSGSVLYSVSMTYLLE